MFITKFDMRKLNQLLSLRGYVFVLQAAALAVMVALSLSLAGCSTQGESSLAGAVVTRSPISDQAALSVETVRARIRTRPAIERRVIAPLRLPALSLAITPEVLVELKFYSGPNFAYISRAYERRKKYIDMLEREFRVAGVPRSLLHVAVVESCFDPHARSRSGATGMWQFMKPTARKYGLEVGLLGDQRKDPLKSTRAAARLLRDLYRQYGDWYLALAGYNGGEFRVDRGIERSHSRDFWQIVRKKNIRIQTAKFVPRIIAAGLLMDMLEYQEERERGTKLLYARRVSDS